MITDTYINERRRSTGFGERAGKLWLILCCACTLLLVLGGVLAIILVFTVGRRTDDQAVCNPSCTNGQCTGTNICTCNAGWSGAQCSNPNCTNPCQHNGVCSAPNTCTCVSEWTGITCETPVCTPICRNGGTCSAPNTCTCLLGWSGSTCATPICTSPCRNNTQCSAPNICTCLPEWTGSNCTTPICTPPCQNNGTCIRPNGCRCTNAWNGSLCQTPVCNPTCLNGGKCTAPNNCTCIEDVWEGPICQTPVRIFWGFDGTLKDLYNNFNGIGDNGPTYMSPGYNGAGSCLWLNRSMNQSVTAPSPPFLNMAYTSFTLEAWMYAHTLCDGSTCGDNALFGQYQQNMQDHSLHIIVRKQQIYLGFFTDDAQGNQILYPERWYHMSYVYDYSTLTQFVYVDGYLDVSRSPAGPYKGTNGSLTIGTNGVQAPNNYFDGCLDSIAYFARAKSAAEVLRDATLVAHLSFNEQTLLDSGPLLINGTGVSHSYTSLGRVGAALALGNSSSYIQVAGLRRLGTDNWPYSLAVWINPKNLAGGTIMHLSSHPDGAQDKTWCIPIMGLTSSGNISIHGWDGKDIPVTGPLMTLNTWTHVVSTYSLTNGIRLYVNGNFISSSTPYAYTAGHIPMILTLGNSLKGTGVCSAGSIRMGQFHGYLDELHVYARELDGTEVRALYAQQ